MATASARLDAEAGADVVDDRGRRRRRQRQHARGAELARPLRELEVVGAEVVAPFRDAVRLVDREERDLDARELRDEALVVEALRRDVEQAQLAAAQPLGDVAQPPSSERLESMRAAGTPSAASASIWSFMSAISGETTTVTPSSSSAGSW